MKAAAALCLVAATLGGCAAFNNTDTRARQIDSFVGYDIHHARRNNMEVDQILGPRNQPAKPVPDSRRASGTPVDCARPVPYEDRILRCT